MEKLNFKELAARWPSAWVSRQEIGTFTGGAVFEKNAAEFRQQGARL